MLSSLLIMLAEALTEIYSKYIRDLRFTVNNLSLYFLVQFQEDR